jgi:gliding motility-associated-like protein
VYITIPSTNLPPVAVTDIVTGTTGNVLVNNGNGVDFDPNGDNITVNTTPVTQPTNGTVTITPTGGFTFTPTDPAFVGLDSFTYVICDDGVPSLCDTGIVYITIPAVNNPPIAVDDNANYTAGNPSVTVNVLIDNGYGQDSDPDGNNITLTSTVVTNPTNGIVTVNTTTGDITWTINSGVPATMPGDTIDTFTYSICDDGIPSLCDTATVYIIATYPNCGVMNDTTVITNLDCQATVTPLCLPIEYDSIGNYLILADGIPITSPITGCALDTSAFYVTPNGNGPFIVQWTVNGTQFNGTSATKAAIVNQMNTWDPTGSWVLVNDTIKATAFNNVFGYGTLKATNSANIPSFRSINIDFNAYGSIFDVDLNTQVIVVIDTVNGCADTSTLIINCTFDNEPPIAINDVNITTINTVAIGNVLTNDFDPDGDSLLVSTTPVCFPTNGSVTITATGGYTYSPFQGFTGTDVFCYQVCDTNGDCDTATVTITIIPIPVDSANNAPIAINDNGLVQTGDTLTSDLVNNDFDPDGDNIIINTTPVTTPTNGTVTINTDGTYTYIPDTSLNGITAPVTDSFNYVICDNGIPSLCDTATVYINIIPDYNGNDNDPPFAVDDVYSTNLNTAVTGFVLPNDYDLNGDSILVTTITATTLDGATVTIHPTTGEFTYTPNTGFIGTDQFIYTICDNGIPSLCADATVYILVLPEPITNNPPVAIIDINTIIQGDTATGNVSTNDFDIDGDNITLDTVPVTNPVNGTVTITANGGYTYVPNPTFTGLDSFTYVICDDGIPSLCDTATVYINVIPEPTDANDAPIANNDAGVTPVNTPLTGDVSNNDFDPDNDPLTFTVLDSTDNGSLVFNPNTGIFTYTPDTNYTGTDVFTYIVCDPSGLCDTATVFIDVLPDNGTNNDAPIANDDAVVTIVNTAVGGNVLPNDFDPNGDSLIVNTTPVVDPTNGTVTIDALGNFIYTPDTNFVGTDQFVYQVCDTAGLCATATVYIIVVPEPITNNPPVAIIDINNTIVDMLVSGNVLTNDFDIDGDSIFVTVLPFVNGTIGTAVLDSNGIYTYTPNAGVSGLDSFTYVICDDGIPSLCDTATVYINIIPEPTDANDAPIANNDAGVTPVNTPLTGDVSNNDFDPDFDPLTFTLLTNPTNGTLTGTFNPIAGTFTYTPDSNYIGLDVFYYVACDGGTPTLCDTAMVVITVIPDLDTLGNDRPFAGDDAFVTNVDVQVNNFLFPNDYDPNGNPFTITTVSSPGNGVVTVDPFTGQFIYTPNAAYVGPDQFTYVICDNGTPALCDTATVYITILPVPITNNPPVAITDINNTVVNVAVSGNVLTNDFDTDGDSIFVTTLPLIAATNGVATIGTNGGYTYTPVTGFVGVDSFTYVICDDGVPSLCDTATVYITVIGEPTDSNDAPIANNDVYITFVNTPIAGSVGNNDFDVDGDSLTFTVINPTNNGSLNGTFNPTTGTFTYTPDSGFIGIDTFFYTACDPLGLCDTAMVVIEVLSDNNGNDNDPPYAADDAFITDMNTVVIGNILPNDSDPNGDSIVVNTIPITQPINGGTVTIAPDGTMIYTPLANYVGPDQFTYSICDTLGLCDTATVYITILPVPTPITNNPPVAVLDINMTFVDIAVSGSVLTNDFDIDGDSIFVTVMPLDTTQNGGLTWLGNGGYIYTPNAGFTGLDSFTYIICDNGTPSLCDTTTVYITVLPLPNTGVNNAPIANNDVGVTPVNMPINGDVSNNDFDPDFDPLTFTLLTNPTNGTLTGTFDPIAGTFTYTPDSNYIGLDTFYYVACDGGTPALCDTAMVVITVIPDLDTTGNDRPFAGDDAFITNVDVPVNNFLFPNDYDPNGDSFTVTTASSPGNGVVTVDPLTGEFIYTPNAGYSGSDQFTYVICDNGIPALCDTATVYILVIPEPYNAPDTVYVVIPVFETDTFCVPIGLIDLQTGVDSIEYVDCSFSVDYGTVVGVNDSCFVFTAGGTPSLMDNDTVCIVLYDSLGNTDTTVFIINVVPDCSGFDTILPPALTVLAPNCLGDGEVCIPIAPNTIGNYDIFLNDSLYNLTSTSVGCDNDSLYFVNTGMIPSSVDSFKLTWTVDGIVNVSAAFTNVGQVLPWMQGIDPNGNWSQSGMMISGFGSGTNYGSMMAQYTLPSTGTLMNVNINTFSTSATGTSVSLPVGTHQLIVVNPLTGCADTSIVTVLCTTTDTLQVVVPTNSITEFCPDASDLPGNVTSITNICPDDSDNGDVITNTTCFDYVAFGVAGYDTACIVMCDDMDFCDTTIYIITVVPTPDTIVITLDLGQDSTLCIPVSELPSTLDTILVGTNCDLLDSADLMVTQIDTCVLIIPGALGSDTTCIVICDSLGFCDTTYIIVNIIDGIDPPIAVNDTVATITQSGDAPPYEPNPINIDVLPNDTIPGSLISISVITPPSSGTAITLPDGTIDYTQLTQCPYVDSFSYEICNGAGCDTAWVFLDVICNDIIIYTGFSPNGDGVNDNFTIEGIEEYPNNNLLIFNRWGNRVLLKSGYLNDWSGTWDGDKMLPDGTYFYILELNDDKGRKFSGYIQIHR